MTPLAALTDEQHGDVTVARVIGEIDASNAGWLGGRLAGLLTNRSVALAVDLSETTYLDSAGIAVLFDLRGSLEQRRQDLRLVVDEASPIARMVRLTGLDAAVSAYPTLDAALDAG